MIAKTLNSSSQSSLFFTIINHKIPAHVGVRLITIRMMQVIKLASSTEFATKVQKVSNFYTEVIHFKLEALGYISLHTHSKLRGMYPTPEL